MELQFSQDYSMVLTKISEKLSQPTQPNDRVAAIAAVRVEATGRVNELRIAMRTAERAAPKATREEFFPRAQRLAREQSGTPTQNNSH